MTDAFDAVLPPRLPAPVEAEAFAPSNIALAKYWGKRDAGLNLPLNSSLSVSLADWGTHTRVTPAERDVTVFNGQVLGDVDPFSAKVFTFVERFRRGQHLPLRVETTNSIPTAAGLASSASGFAALVLALGDCFQLALPRETLSMLARFGSGSATRSLWQGFVRWDRGRRPDGRDSHARPLDTHWADFRIAVVPVDTGPKARSSRDGMGHTVATSPLYPGWPDRAEADCDAMEAAVRSRDFDTLGPLAEANALAMHATMFSARPSLIYLKVRSWQMLERLWQAREDGLSAYATMDAGPNVKVLFLGSEEAAVATLFPEARIIAPFAHSS
ncbi:MAG: diphosphomevalonate decarboxylase [Pseudomonadota bacterium]